MLQSTSQERHSQSTVLPHLTRDLEKSQGKRKIKLKQEPSLSAENASAGNPEPGMKSLARKEKVTWCFT